MPAGTDVEGEGTGAGSHAVNNTTASPTDDRDRDRRIKGGRSLPVPWDAHAVDVVEFLCRYAPFSDLDEEQVRDIARRIEIAHYPAGEVILRQDGPPAESLYVIRKGAVELLDDGVVLDLLGEGELFGQFSMFTHESPAITVRAHEDSLCYLVPASAADAVLDTRKGRSFVLGTMRRRVRAATEQVRGDPGDARLRTVGGLVRRDAITIEPGRTVAEAAGLMRDEHVSCLLIRTERGIGVVTDRDLRIRIVAERGSVDAPVETIATSPAITIEASALAGDALTVMLAKGIHHLPVLEQGRLVGVVTDTDLMGLGRHTPFALKSAILRARSRAAAAAAARDLPLVVVALVEARTDPVEVGRVIALVGDAITDRLIALAAEELGSPPATFAWLALGSAARFEQSLKTDQDHALAYDPPPGADLEAIEATFGELAEFVTAGLEEAGFPRCRGDAMAVHPSMRKPIDDWAERFRRWMSQPDVDTSILSSIGFDFRRQAGALEAEPRLAEAVRQAATHPGFLRLMGRRALAFHPPTGFVRDLVVEAKGEHAGRLDVKHGGITIVTSLARAWALQAGSSAVGTLERLEAAAETGTLAPEIAEELAQAFRFLWEVRLRHQADQVSAGEQPDDFVDPTALGSFQRSGLKEAFHVIRRAQRQLATELGLELR
jgi:CBS domain-containing protein